jgi:predicted ribosome quality control (RQC) complex YloA/Tae2 family protein
MIRGGEFAAPSEAADHYFTSLLAERENANRAATARGELRRKISQQQKLLKQLERDLREHASPEQHKRIGDLLLANLSTAKRAGDRVTLIDYFAEDVPAIEVEVDQNLSLQEEAARRFARYSRSKRAITQIQSRIELGQKQLRKLQAEQESLEETIADGTALTSGKTSVPPTSAGGTKKPPPKVPGTRRYLSSDGFEILVGRTSNDNDQLTFKVARPNDLWLHASDYGGSHVVIRRQTRKEVPHQTIIEAAQLAAYFSQAKKDPKVDVHYTERKFVTKPKGAKPGLVRLQRFKNITVTPKEAATRG